MKGLALAVTSVNCNKFEHCFRGIGEVPPRIAQTANRASFVLPLIRDAHKRSESFKAIGTCGDERLSQCHLLRRSPADADKGGQLMVRPCRAQTQLIRERVPLRRVEHILAGCKAVDDCQVLEQPLQVMTDRQARENGQINSRLTPSAAIAGCYPNRSGKSPDGSQSAHPLNRLIAPTRQVRNHAHNRYTCHCYENGKDERCPRIPVVASHKISYQTAILT